MVKVQSGELEALKFNFDVFGLEIGAFQLISYTASAPIIFGKLSHVLSVLKARFLLAEDCISIK